MVFWIDKGLVQIRYSAEVLLTPLATCGVVYIKHCGTKNGVFGDGWGQLWWLFLYKQPIPFPVVIFGQYCVQNEKVSKIYIFLVILMDIIYVFFYSFYLRSYKNIITRLVRYFGV